MKINLSIAYVFKHWITLQKKKGATEYEGIGSTVNVMENIRKSKGKVNFCVILFNIRAWK